MTEEKYCRYGLIAIIIISLGIFVYGKVDNKGRQIGKLSDSINKLYVESEELGMDIERLNEEISMAQTDTMSGYPEEDLTKYTDDYLATLKAGNQSMKEDPNVFSPLPLEEQVNNAFSSTTYYGFSMTYDSQAGFGEGYDYSLEKISDTLYTITNNQDKAEKYDVFLFGPRGLVVKYDTIKEEVADDLVAGPVDKNLDLYTESLSFSGLHSLGD